MGIYINRTGRIEYLHQRDPRTDAPDGTEYGWIYYLEYASWTAGNPHWSNTQTAEMGTWLTNGAGIAATTAGEARLNVAFSVGANEAHVRHEGGRDAWVYTSRQNTGSSSWYEAGWTGSAIVLRAVESGTPRTIQSVPFSATGFVVLRLIHEQTGSVRVYANGTQVITSNDAAIPSLGTAYSRTTPGVSGVRITGTGASPTFREFHGHLSNKITVKGLDPGQRVHVYGLAPVTESGGIAVVDLGGTTLRPTNIWPMEPRSTDPESWPDGAIEVRTAAGALVTVEKINYSPIEWAAGGDVWEMRKRTTQPGGGVAEDDPATTTQTSSTPTAGGTAGGGAIGDSATWEGRWRPASQPDAWQVWFPAQAAMTAPFLNATVAGEYVVSVRPLYSSGTPGGWTDSAPFTLDQCGVPALVLAQSPCDQIAGITVTEAPPAPPATRYDYQIASLASASTNPTTATYALLPDGGGRPSPFGFDRSTLSAGWKAVRIRRTGTTGTWTYSEPFEVGATRAPTAGELATIGAAKRTLGFKLIINDSAGIPRDRSEFLTGGTINADINQPVTSAELTIRREHRGASLAPMLTASPLNQPNKAVDLAHGFSIAAATVPAGVQPTASDFRTLFCGNVDSHEFARPEAQVAGRDIYGQLIMDKEIEEERVYGAANGTVSLEAGIQAIFDDNMPPSKRVTVVVPTPTGATMGQYSQPKGPLLPAGRERALQIGYDLRGLWRSATGLYSMTLYEPTRNALAAPSYIFGPDEYLDVQAVPEDVSLVRNRLRIFYGPGEGDARASVLVEDPASAAYPELGGYGPRYAEIHLDPGSLIQTAPEAVTVGKRIITDMSQPAATMVVEVPFFWLAELNAVYRFEADHIRFAADMDLACVGFRHEIRKGEQSGTWRARTFLTMRARPAAQTYEWLTVERMPAPSTPTTAPGMQITKFAAAVNDPGKCGVSPATVITDWAITGLVAGTQVVLEYEAISGDKTGEGIWTAVGTYPPNGNPVGHTWTGYETVSSFFANQTNPAMLAYRIRLVDAGGVQLKDANDVPLIRSVPRFFVFFKKCAP